MGTVQVSDSRMEAAEFVKSDRCYKWTKRLLRFIYTFCAFDIFKLYKREHIEVTEQTGRLSRFWMSYCIPISAYLSIKPIIVLLLRTVRSTVSARNLNGFIPIADELNWIINFIGDPFSSLTFAYWHIAMFFPGLAFWTKAFVPFTFKYLDTVDISFARFALQPKLEVRRFDMKAAEILNQLIEALKFQRYKLSHYLRFTQNGVTDLNSTLHGLHTIQQQQDDMQILLHQIHLIRPESLTPDWHQRSNKVILLLFGICVPISTFLSFTALAFYALLNWRRRCDLGGYLVAQQEDGWVGCRLTDVFSLSELLAIVEINLMVDIFAITSVAVLATNHMLQIRHQHCMSKSVSERLGKLVGELRNVNLETQLKVGGRSSRERFNSLLSENIVGVRMLQRETIGSVATLAYGARCSIGVVFMFTIASFASIKAQNLLANSRQLGPGGVETTPLGASNLNLSIIILLSAWAIIWIITNITFMTCAILPSGIARLNRLIYSLIAQLIRLQNEHRSPRELQLLAARDYRILVDDPITSLWRRLALNGNHRSEQLTICVLNNRLTYERVLAINFYVVTIISMVALYI